MTDKNLYKSVTGTTSVQSISMEASYSQLAANAIVECTATTLDMGDAITIDMGYEDNHAVMFRGFVKRVEYTRPSGIVTLTCYDELVKASDYFIAADNPEDPLTYHNIGSYALVQSLLSEASITHFIGEHPGFTFGTNPDGAKFNLQSVADAIQFVANVTGFTIYCDTSGSVHYDSRKPYVTGTDVSSGSLFTGNTGNIISCQYSKSTDKTRNVVRVYGKDNITSRASAANSYLVVDQTIVIAHELIDTQTLADNTASVNLDLLNRLTESYELELYGNVAYQPRLIFTLTESFSGANNRKVFFYRVAHRMDQGGWTTSVTAVP